MINVVSQGLKFIEETGMDNVGFHLDTFHMHLEEKDSADAIRRAGKKIFHFHACENDRGVPGTGQVRWNEIAKALKEIELSGTGRHRVFHRSGERDRPSGMYLAGDRAQPGCDCLTGTEVPEIPISVMDTLNI